MMKSEKGVAFVIKFTVYAALALLILAAGFGVMGVSGNVIDDILRFIRGEFGGGGVESDLGNAIQCSHYRCYYKECAGDRLSDIEDIVTPYGSGDEAEKNCIPFFCTPFMEEYNLWKSGEKTVCGDKAKQNPVVVKVEAGRITADDINFVGYSPNVILLHDKLQGAINKANPTRLIFSSEDIDVIEGKCQGFNCITLGSCDKNDPPCGSKEIEYPAGTYYIWTFYASAADHGGLTTVVWHEHPSPRNCENECEARGYDYLKCSAEGDECDVYPFCALDTCKFDCLKLDKGESCGDDKYCYCYKTDDCDCDGWGTCTNGGCEVADEKGFVCCKIRKEGEIPPGESEFRYEWEEGTECSFGSKTGPGGNCEDIVGDLDACKEHCVDIGYTEEETTYISKVCECSDPTCEIYNEPGECDDDPTCKWCDMCKENYINKFEKGICLKSEDFLTDCTYECKMGKCFAECDENNPCGVGRECEDCECECTGYQECVMECSVTDCSEVCAEIGEECIYAESCSDTRCSEDSCSESTCDNTYCPQAEGSGTLGAIRCCCASSTQTTAATTTEPSGPSTTSTSSTTTRPLT